MGKPRSTSNRAEEIFRGPPDKGAAPLPSEDPKAAGANHAEVMRVPEDDRSPQGEANTARHMPSFYDPTWVRQHRDFSRKSREYLLEQLKE